MNKWKLLVAANPKISHQFELDIGEAKSLLDEANEIGSGASSDRNLNIFARRVSNRSDTEETEKLNFSNMLSLLNNRRGKIAILISYLY